MCPGPEKKVITSAYYDKEYFTRHADYYDYNKSRFQKYRIKNILKLYTPGKSEVVVDMGVGWGTFTLESARLGKAVIGIDYSMLSLTLCSRIIKQKQFTNATLACADVQNIPLLSDYCDLIICADLVEHLYPDQYLNFIKECHRILKPGGKMIIWAPNRQYWLEVMRQHHWILEPYEGHVDYKSMEQLVESLQTTGFDILKAYNVESHLPGINLIERAFSGFTPLFRRRIAVLGIKRAL